MLPDEARMTGYGRSSHTRMSSNEAIATSSQDASAPQPPSKTHRRVPAGCSSSHDPPSSTPAYLPPPIFHLVAPPAPVHPLQLASLRGRQDPPGRLTDAHVPGQDFLDVDTETKRIHLMTTIVRGGIDRSDRSDRPGFGPEMWNRHLVDRRGCESSRSGLARRIARRGYMLSSVGIGCVLSAP